MWANIFIAERIELSTEASEVGGSTWLRSTAHDSVIFIFYWQLVSHYLADHGAASWSPRVSVSFYMCFSQTVSLRWRFEPVKIVEQKGNSRIKAITAEKKIIFVRLIYILARNTREFHQIRCISSFKHNIRNHWRHIYIRTTQNKYQHLLRCEDFHEYPYICTINRRHYWLWYISVTLDSITQVKSEILLRKIYSQVRFVRR